jgi:uncharacterized FlgJ-related protein
MFYIYNKEKLDFQKLGILSYVKFIFIVLFILLILSFGVIPRANLNNLTLEEKLIIIRENREFSEKKLRDQIYSLNFRFPHIVLAQAYLESGNFKSTIFIENNNLFGMKEAKVRSTVSKGTNRNHAFYEGWQESVIDYALYYSTYLSNLKTESEYYAYLQRRYAEDPHYVSRIKKIVKIKNLKE